MPDIPDYYRQFVEKPKPPAPPPAAPAAPSSRPAPAEARPSARPQAPQKAPPPFQAVAMYLANTFSLALPEEWRDRTLHVIAGPVAEDLQHNVLIDVEPDVEVDDLADYADRQVKTLEESLKGCRVLLQEAVNLECGIPAFRAIFIWYPMEDKRIYQEQIYVVHEGTAYKLTATFTKKTRKTLGPQVERMMLTFTPAAPAAPPPRPVRGY